MRTCLRKEKYPRPLSSVVRIFSHMNAYRALVSYCLLAIPRSLFVEVSGVAILYADRALPSKPQSRRNSDNLQGRTRIPVT